MKRILRAYGPPGKNGTQFNWCDPDEVVTPAGDVCCNSLSCGCNRAFHGITSRKGTTLAVVCEADDEQYRDLCGIAYANCVRSGWGEGKAMLEVSLLADLQTALAGHPVGSVVSIRKMDDFEFHVLAEEAITGAEH